MSFWDYVEKTESCWTWLGGKNAQGYGYYRVGQSKVRAHRFAFQEFRGPVPDGLELDHLCRNRACVNPEHLEAVSHAENIARRRPDSKDVCVNGHLLTSENTSVRKNSRGYDFRACMDCARDSRRKYKESHLEHL